MKSQFKPHWEDSDSEETVVLYTRDGDGEQHKTAGPGIWLRACALVSSLSLGLIFAMIAGGVTYMMTVGTHERCNMLHRLHECDHQPLDPDNYSITTRHWNTTTWDDDDDNDNDDDDGAGVWDQFDVDQRNVTSVNWKVAWKSVEGAMRDVINELDERGSTLDTNHLARASTIVEYLYTLAKLATLNVVIEAMNIPNRTASYFLQSRDPIRVTFFEPTFQRAPINHNRFVARRGIILRKAHKTGIRFLTTVTSWLGTDEPPWFEIPANKPLGVPTDGASNVGSLFDDDNLSARDKVWMGRLYILMNRDCSGHDVPSSFRVWAGHLIKTTTSTDYAALLADVLTVIRNVPTRQPTADNNISISIPLAVQFMRDNAESDVFNSISPLDNSVQTSIRDFTLYLIHHHVCSRFLIRKIIPMIERQETQAMNVLTRFKIRRTTSFTRTSDLVTRDTEINYWVDVMKWCTRLRMGMNVAP